MSNPAKVLFFSYADRRYDLFAIPYVYFALRSNPDSLVEICLQDYDSFLARYAQALAMLEETYPGRFLIRQSELARKQPGIIPNVVRFVEAPRLQARYIYIGDIDLLVFEDVCAVHEELIARYALPFSNILRLQFARSEKPRLSGLHFCEYDRYYPLAPLQDLDLAVENDEYVLYECMRRKGLMVPMDFQQRPECGLHMSLSRDPLGRTTGSAGGHYSRESAHGWGGRHYYGEFLRQIREPGFARLYPHLDMEFRLLLLAAEGLATGKSHSLHRAATSFLLDKRLIVKEVAFSAKDIYDRRHDAIVSGDMDAAESIGITLCMVWPNRLDVWFKQAWLWMQMGKVEFAVEALSHIADMQGGVAFLQSGDFIKVHGSVIADSGRAGHELLRRISA